MDFNLSTDHEILRDSVRSFAENEIKPVAKELDQKEEFSYETMQKMAELGLFGAEKFTPRRRIVEQVVNFDGRADRMRRRPRTRDLAIVGLDLPGGIVVTRPRTQAQARDRRDAR